MVARSSMGRHNAYGRACQYMGSHLLLPLTCMYVVSPWTSEPMPLSSKPNRWLSPPWHSPSCSCVQHNQCRTSHNKQGLRDERDVFVAITHPCANRNPGPCGLAPHTSNIHDATCQDGCTVFTDPAAVNAQASAHVCMVACVCMLAHAPACLPHLVPLYMPLISMRHRPERHCPTSLPHPRAPWTSSGSTATLNHAPLHHTRPLKPRLALLVGGQALDEVPAYSNTPELVELVMGVQFKQETNCTPVMVEQKGMNVLRHTSCRPRARAATSARPGWLMPSRFAAP